MKWKLLNKLLKFIIATFPVFLVFSGNRCEKHQKFKISDEKKANIIIQQSLDVTSEDSHENFSDSLDSSIQYDDDRDLSDAQLNYDCDEKVEMTETVENEGEAKKQITFKYVPKIPAFKPWDEQPVAKMEELYYLTNHEKTCKILSEGKFFQKKGLKTLVPMKRERIADGLAWRFQIFLSLSDSEEPIIAFFKPRQENYWDWLKEIHAYNIARIIDAPSIPTVLRFFDKRLFSWWLEHTPEEETAMFKWEGKKEPKIRGALKYWVPSYVHRRLGKRIANEEYMNEIAASLHPANKEKLAKEFPLYLELGRGIIFDYLILNEDRPENLGTILLPDGTYKLVLIDNGLSLGVSHGGRTVMKKMFKSMKIFPRDMIQKIKELDEKQVTKMFRPENDPVMWLPEICIKQLMERKDDILSTVEKLHEKWGDIIWY